MLDDIYNQSQIHVPSTEIETTKYSWKAGIVKLDKHAIRGVTKSEIDERVFSLWQFRRGEQGKSKKEQWY